MVCYTLCVMKRQCILDKFLVVFKKQASVFKVCEELTHWKRP